ncbi:hypothetical protein LTR09_002021 [Extremus antarcticus]|uniref:Uncharacterized protein n=1 Tax=Extremus antarcticus TaxID=702011 RepID=A0AAJ0LVK1_9PEZI|nr:hypothetical protein LTR09_002021 [Extremus antarcticus]
MAPANDQVYSSSIQTEGNTEKPTFRDGDKALDFLRTEAEVGEGEDIDEKKLVWKIDKMVVPLMFCCYLLQYLDKSLLNYAALPYGQISRLLRLCLGTVVACTAGCNSYGSLVATRFLLGMFESAISPSLILITSMWYKRDEQPKRVGLWYIGVGVASIIGALLSYGFQFYTGETFKSWQVLFLVVGLITVATGGVVIAFMPDNPMSARKLTHAERVAAVERLRENQTGVENKHFKPYQLLAAFKDPQTWLLAFITTAASIPNGAVGSFQSIIISGLGYSDKQTALMQIPGGVIAVASVLLATFSASKFNLRGGNIIIWSMIGGILGGSLLAFMPMSFYLGNILGPLTFRDEDAPNYTPTKITIVAVDSVAILATVVLLLYYRWMNKKRDNAMANVEHQRDVEFADLTDLENKEFRYKY